MIRRWADVTDHRAYKRQKASAAPPCGGAADPPSTGAADATRSKPDLATLG